nr:hypothetical protein [Tanacetum cinerariifolium]
MILNSLQNGPLVWPTVIKDDGTTRTKKYEELSITEKLQADCLAVPVFNQGDDPIACLNKAMDFLTAKASLRPRNAEWFKEKAMLAKARESSQILDEDQLAFLTDPGIPNGHAAQTTILNTAAFQTKDLDAYDSECDDVSNAKAVLMANLSNYGSAVISEVPHHEPYHTDMDNQSVHTMQDSEQTSPSDSNIISYS